MSNIFYRRPSQEWEQALPIGNGRLGGMVFGGIEKELIQVNEENMWLGGYTDRINPDARDNLSAVRHYISSGGLKRPKDLWM